MKKSLDVRALLDMISFSTDSILIDSESYNCSSGNTIRSFEILEDSEITLLRADNGDDMVTKCRLTGKTLPAGTQWCNNNEYVAITVTGLIKLNMTNPI